MAKGKQSTAIQPLTGEIVNVPSTTKGGVPTMKEPEGKNGDVSPDVKDSGIVHETKLELIKKDVDGALAIARQFDRDLARLRVGPDGLWTRLVEKHVFVLADWNGARDAFRATLWKTVQDSVKAENPQPQGMDDSTWLTMVNSLTDSIVKKPQYQVLVSQFNTLGRFFQKDGPGRDRLIAILKGEAKDESGKLVIPKKEGNALAWQPVFKVLQREAPPSTRGRKRGTTNKDSNAKTGKAPGLPSSAPQVSPQKIVTDPAQVQKQVRESTMQACIEYINKLSTDREFLVPVMLALANKLKASGDENLQDVGLLMIDSAQAGTVPDEEQEDEEEVTPKLAAGVKRRGGL